MALTVEDGTGIATADAYDSEANVAAFAVERGNTAWVDLDADIKDAYIRESTEYLDATYRWKGAKNTDAQALAWPRSNAVNEDGYTVLSTIVPAAVTTAMAHLALARIDGVLLPADDRGGRIRRKRTRVEGAIDTETEFEPGAPAGRTFRTVDGILRGLFEGKAGGISIPLRRT